MLRSSLCDYSYAYMLESAAITFPNAAAADKNKIKSIITENCAPFTNCIREMKKTQIDNVKDIDIAILMYSLIEYSDKYFKTSRSLWHYYWDELF